MSDESRCCREFTRSELARSAAAQAGRGLPVIEAGMPVPAGTGISRRSFISRSAGLALAVYGAGKMPLRAFEQAIAEAATPQRTLLSVFFGGGLDAMTVLAPVGDPRYARLRPTLALSPEKGTPFSEDERLHWHPAAKALQTLHAEGKVTVFPAIGYSHPNQSHFTSRHFWEIGELEVGSTTGWLGRYIDLVGDEENPLQGLSLDGVLSPMLATAARPVSAIDGVDVDLRTSVDEPIATELLKSFTNLGAMPADSTALRQLRSSTAWTAELRNQLGDFGETTSPVDYPGNDLGRRLSRLAALLGAGLPIRAATVHAVGGYDTHAGQAKSLIPQLRASCEALLAFQRDLEARGLADRVLIEAWSEFGRRPEESGSRGTDHGAAGCAFLIGSQAGAPMVGEFPGLSHLDKLDNVRHTSDYRAMYCSLLEQWLGQDAAPIIPGADTFARPVLLKT